LLDIVTIGLSKPRWISFCPALLLVPTSTPNSFPETKNRQAAARSANLLRHIRDSPALE
jgi:hypothetical protein